MLSPKDYDVYKTLPDYRIFTRKITGDPCPTCEGSGWLDKDYKDDCRKCGGTGLKRSTMHIHKPKRRKRRQMKGKS